jgi:hypothetical protein
VILTRVGFELFNPTPSGGIVPRTEDGNANVAFGPLAMPIMFGPVAIATLISMASTIKQSPGEMLHFLAASAAIVACMAVIYLSLVYAEPILRKIGRQGIDAATRIVGFFVAAMGMGLIFNGAVGRVSRAIQVRRQGRGRNLARTFQEFSANILAPASLRDTRTAEGTGACSSPLRSAMRSSPDRPE